MTAYGSEIRPRPHLHIRRNSIIELERAFQIPTEREALVYLRQSALSVMKTLPFDSEDPNVLENTINTHIRVESQKQDHPMQLHRKRQTLGALADTVMARPSTIPVELMQNAMAFMSGQSTMPVEKHYELIKPVTRFNLFLIYHKRKIQKQGPEFCPEMIKEFGLTRILNLDQIEALQYEDWDEFPRSKEKAKQLRTSWMTAKHLMKTLLLIKQIQQ